MSLLPQLVLYEEDQQKLLEVTTRLVDEANAKAVFLVDKNGQLVNEAGELKGIGVGLNNATENPSVVEGDQGLVGLRSAQL